jgi:opacity protein-like surface antigen
MEKVLSELESILDLWNVWADCKITIPPAQETTKRLITNALKIKFPDPPLKLSDDIKTAAEKEITRNYFQTGALPGESVDPGIQRFGLTTGAIFSFVNMSALNNYFDYLNKTWDGNIEPIHNSFGFDFNVSYFFTQNIGIKAGIENLNSKTEGTLEAYGSNYKSSNQTTGILAGLEFMTNPITENITLLGSACVGPYFSRYSENENGFLTEGTDNSFGYKLAGGLEFMINHSIGIQINSGYRSVKFNDFNTNFFMPGNPPVELDYSGFFGELKAIVKF